jgi:tetratricopeptide (TPR) repeat protein
VAHIVSAKIYQFLGRYDEALIAAKKASQFSASGNTEAMSLIGYTYALMGRRPEAEKILQELQGLAADKFVPPYNLATLFLGLGDTEKALDWLEKGYQERDVHMVFLNVEPKWDSLRSAPQLLSLLRRIALG